MLVENLGLLATPFGQTLRTLTLTCDHETSRSNLHVIRRKYTVNEPTLTLPTERVTTHGVKKNGLIRRKSQRKGIITM